MKSQMLFPTFEKVKEALPFSHRYALIKFGGGVVGMSGSIAGNTFSRNRYGAYVRARTKPVNPNTDRQVAVRSVMAALTTRWSQTLDAAKRAAWDLYAARVNMVNKLGETINLSGFNHYIRSNSILLSLSLTVVDDGPVIFELPAKDPTFAITATEAPNNITATFDNTMDWSIEDGGLLCMFQGAPQNAQRNFFGGPWRLWTAVQGADPGGAVSPKIAPSVFAVSETQRLWVYARIIRADGRISTPFRDDAFVTA